MILKPYFIRVDNGGAFGHRLDWFLYVSVCKASSTKDSQSIEDPTTVF